MRWRYDKSFGRRTGYCPYQAAFDSPQAAISEVIEGDSLLLKPFGTSKIGVVCSKNQSLLKYNRQLEDGSTIRGRFLVCGLSESKMLGLSEEQAERYNRLLFFPQVEDMRSGDLPVAKVRPPDEHFGGKISFWERLSR